MTHSTTSAHGALPRHRRVRSRLDRDVDAVLAFAQRYPEATFPIDDETGRSLTLLFTTRQALRTCAPAAAARVDRAMPQQYRTRPQSYVSSGHPRL